MKNRFWLLASSKLVLCGGSLAASSQELEAGRSGSGILQALAHEPGAIFDQFTVFGRECRREMTVNIEFARHLAMHEDRNYDLRFGFERAGKIALIAGYVIHNHGFSR